MAENGDEIPCAQIDFTFQVYWVFGVRPVMVLVFAATVVVVHGLLPETFHVILYFVTPDTAFQFNVAAVDVTFVEFNPDGAMHAAGVTEI